MEQELISKKELLELTNISYGQLYRWKRKNLIPEEWFIKKSSFTGQETFFPRKSILERVDKIKNMKDEASLDDLAEIFSPELSDNKLSEEQILKQNIVIRQVLDIYKEQNADKKEFNFNEILFMSILQNFLVEGSISLEEGKIVLDMLEENYNRFSGKNCEVIFLRKMGVGVCLITLIPTQIYFEKLSRVIMRVNVSQCIEDLKTKLAK